MEEAAEEMMEEFLLKMRQTYPDLVPIKKAKALLVVGTPVTRIVEVAEKKQINMIIIGLFFLMLLLPLPALADAVSE